MSLDVVFILALVLDTIAGDLDPEEALCLRRLGILEIFGVDADFGQALAAALWNRSPTEATDLLERLKRRGVVTRSGSERWLMEPIIRDYAQQRLVDQDEEYQLARTRYIAHFRDLGCRGEVWQPDRPDAPHLEAVGNALVEHVKTLTAAADDMPAICRFLQTALTHAQTTAILQPWADAAIEIGLTAGRWELAARGHAVYGEILLQKEEFDQARASFQKMEEIATDNGHFTMAAEALLHLGQGLLAQHPKESSEVLQQGLQRLDEGQVGDQGLRARLFVALSKAHLRRHAYDEALAALTGVSDIAEAGGLDNPRDQFELQRLFGLLEIYQGNSDKAREHLNAAEQVAREAHDDFLLAELSIPRGHACLAVGDHEQAEEQFNRARRDAEALPFPYLMGYALTGLAQTRLAQNELTSAQEYLEQARDGVESGSDEQLKATLYALHGEVRFKLGDDPDPALEDLHRAFKQFEQLEDTGTAVNILKTIGEIYHKTRRIEEGVHFLRDALERTKAYNNQYAESIILGWLGMFLNHADTREEASQCFKEMQPLLEKLKDNLEKASVQAVQGLVYMSVGRQDDAVRVLSAAQSLFGCLNDRSSEGEVLVLLAYITLFGEDLPAAERHIKDLERIVAQKQGTPLAVALFNLRGLMHLLRNNPAEAKTDLDLAKQINENVDDPAQTFVNFFFRGLWHLHQEEFDESRSCLTDALKIADQQTQIPEVAMIGVFLGLLDFAAGNNEEGAKRLEDAAKTLEEAGLESDAGDHSVGMLREIAKVMRSTEQDVPAETVQALWTAGNWKEVDFLLRMRGEVLREAPAQALIQQAIDSGIETGQVVISRTLRAYQDLLRRRTVRDKSDPGEHLGADAAILNHWWAYRQRVEGRYSKALRYIDQALKLNPSDIESHIERGWILRGLGRLADSAHQFESVTQSWPNDYRTYQGLGVVAFEREDRPAALSALEKAITIDPDNPLTLQWKGAVHQAGGALELALSDLDGAIRCDSANGDHFYWRALILLDLNRLPDAKRDLAEAHKIDSGKASVRARASDSFWQGIADHLLGNKIEASVHWKETASFIEDNPRDWLAPLYLLVVDKDAEKARKSYEMIVGQPYAWHALTENARHLGLLSRIFRGKRGDLFANELRFLNEEIETRLGAR